MKEQYVIGIDQSTQGTKAILINEQGEIVEKAYLPHEQIISPEGWVSHDGEEIYRNTVTVACSLVERSGIDKGNVAAIGISNQRETVIAWDRESGHPVAPAIVWQCARGKEVTDSFLDAAFAASVREKTGLPLSPYFSAAKAGWLMRHSARARELSQRGRLCIGTIDSWLVFLLTGGAVFKTDVSNASRTQLLDLRALQWDRELCEVFGVPMSALAEITDSNGDFGSTTLEGFFDAPVPIRAVLGDSHAALFGQSCTQPGMAKATYGTGSSIMMNVGPVFRQSESGLVTSLAWGIDGTVDYVLEGNINYSGAVITWLQKDLGVIRSARETASIASEANPADTTYLVPAFSGLGAPYWNEDAHAVICGMSRTTGRAELVKAALESIGYQVADILRAMEKDSGLTLTELRVDGGPTANEYLMQFQSDISRTNVRVPQAEELSGIGAAMLAGITLGVYDAYTLKANRTKAIYSPGMTEEERIKKYNGWKNAVAMTTGGK